jgi:hypothetical protein
VWQIAVKDYKFGKGKNSSLTKATYDAVGNKFRSLWGKEAGWAHSVLFTADLKAFSERLVLKTESLEVKAEVKLENGPGLERQVKIEKVNDTIADSSELSSVDAGSDIEDLQTVKKIARRVRQIKKTNGRSMVVESEVIVQAEPESPARKEIVGSEPVLSPTGSSGIKREGEEDGSRVEAADMMSRIKRRRRG